MVNQSSSSWPKRITVHRKIVTLLSRSLYSDFPRAVREMVSNSYDADATVVRISINLGHKELTVEDNGNGMSVEQFENYLRIAGQKYEGKMLSPKFQRKRIGRFGIGFLASFPFCESIEITSKKEGEESGFTAILPSKRFVQESESDEDVSSIPVDGYTEPRVGKTADHFTRIRVVGLNELIEEYFSPKPESRQISIESLPGLSRLKWNLCETLPLDFKNKQTDLAKCLGRSIIGMEVWLNEEQLYRNDPGGQVIQSTGETYIKKGALEFGYAITTNWSIIHPVEARGLKIRMNQVGIGPRTYLDIEKERRTFSHLYWITGEIHIIAGLDDALSLTRDSFVWTTELEELKEFFHVVLLRTHGKVENIAQTEKALQEAFIDKKIPSISAAELVERSTKQLAASGVEIVHVQANEGDKGSPPVKIDKKRMVAFVIDGHPMVSNVIEFSTEGVPVRYRAFEKAVQLELPVRVSDDGAIEINTAYPVFKSKRKGDIMKRVHLLMFLAKRQCKSADEMYGYLVKRFREEFE
ncbi:MAG: ATP-binding protein [Dehalococcoidia bacterium]|nr:ATP-binding protein [Dehalococcoidia bacterium]